MARKLQALSMSFRQSQKEYLARVRAQKTGDEAFDFLNEESKKAISEAPDQVTSCMNTLLSMCLVVGLW